MTSKARNILIVAGVFVAVTIGVVAYGGYKLYTFLSSASFDREVPAELKEARVTKGTEFLDRIEFFREEPRGWVKVIKEGSSIPDEEERQRYINAGIARGLYNFSDLRVFGNEVIAAAEFGAFTFDLQGNQKNYITFEPPKQKLKVGPIETESRGSHLGNLRIVQLEPGRVGYMSFGPGQGMLVFDEKGKIFWSKGDEVLDFGEVLRDGEKSFEQSMHVLEGAVGDLDGDGISEYVVARKNDGIRVYDRTGSEKWFHPDEFPSKRLGVFDVDNDKKNDLVQIGGEIFDLNGKVIGELKGTPGEGLVLDTDKKGKLAFRYIVVYDGKLSYTNEKQEVLFNSDAPLSKIAAPVRVDAPRNPEMSDVDDIESVVLPKGMLVRLRKDQPKFLAVVAAFIGMPRANFYVYDQSGTLVYHELLPEEAETIAVVPAGDVENILIGGKESIWKYAPR